MKRAQWQNGKRTVSGSWNYSPVTGYFTIVLDQRDRITGRNKTVRTTGSGREKPEWGNWLLVEEQTA